MEMNIFDSCICGHHVSKGFWMPLINKELRKVEIYMIIS